MPGTRPREAQQVIGLVETPTMVSMRGFACERAEDVFA